MIREVVIALIPILVFGFIYIFIFCLAFYMFGQHQVGFDYYSEENQGDIIEGIIKDCISDDPAECQERYELKLADEREENKEAVTYDTAWLAIMFVWQILMGDATHENFFDYRSRFTDSPTPYFLYALYLIASFIIMIMILNIIIAIMGEVQVERTNLGRAVIYKKQLAVVLDSIYKFDDQVRLKSWFNRPILSDTADPVDKYKQMFPRFLVVALNRKAEDDNEVTQLADQILDNHEQLRQEFSLKTFQLDNSLQMIKKLILSDDGKK